MDEGDKIERKANPRETANVFNILTYAWLLNIFRTGSKRDIELEDLYQPLYEHKSNVIGDKLSAVWEKDVKRFYDEEYHYAHYNMGRKTPSIIKALFKVFGFRFTLYGFILASLELFIRIYQPIALGGFLQCIIKKKTPDLYYNAVYLILSITVYFCLFNSYCMAMHHMAMKLKIGSNSLIYRKILRLSKTALKGTKTGEIISLITNDIAQFRIAFPSIHHIWIAPLQTIISTYCIYRDVGLLAICGVGILFLFLPFQIIMGRATTSFRERSTATTGERINLTTEIIKGIQTIKMYTWENIFDDMMGKARNNELNVIKHLNFMNTGILLFGTSLSKLSLFVSILVYVLYGDEMTTQKAFILVGFYTNLHHTMTVIFPYAITHVAIINVTLKRLQTFLLNREVKYATLNIMRDEIDDNSANESGISNNGFLTPVSTTDDADDDDHKSMVIFKNVHAKWLHNDPVDVLKGINMNIKSGELVAIIGKVGSGKSSLIDVILEELPITRGELLVPKNISYASQEPWLFHGSLQKNIVFGRTLESVRYNEVIKACQLEQDFSQMYYGDKTIVGERGMCLSGGQRTRVNLARAVYADAELYIFDDPFSTLDINVGKRLFKKCIEEYLQGRTRILVTHQTQYLKNVDKIIVLHDGGIISTGTYHDLLNMGININAINEDNSDEQEYQNDVVPLNTFSTDDMTNFHTEIQPETVNEIRKTGSVKSSLYSSYLTAGKKYFLLSTVLVGAFIAQFSAIAIDIIFMYWIDFESNNKLNQSSANITYTLTISNISQHDKLSRTTYIYIICSLIALSSSTSAFRLLGFYEICIQASKKIHSAMFRSIVNAKIHFFHKNPSSCILNRFTGDMGKVDQVLPHSFMNTCQVALRIISTFLFVFIISKPIIIIPSVMVFTITYFLRRYYVTTSCSIERLEGITTSPLINRFTSTLEGLTTIRALKAHSILIEEFDYHQDSLSSVSYITIVAPNALGMWLDCLNVIFTIVVITIFLFSPDNVFVNDGANAAGLVITQCLSMMCDFQWGVKASAQIENDITSFERVLEYTENIESEPSLVSLPDKVPPCDWPKNAKIEFKDVSLSYDFTITPPILKNISFQIASGTHVGIVGRTGAGKSSIVSALFRFGYMTGTIEIDEHDISLMGLHDLRSKISIIPQEPFLFSANLRKNLDPFDEYEDEVLYRALKDVELDHMGLELNIENGGTNLSVGQRQLVCFARAIIKKNKILVLDEATANIDTHTDQLIQKNLMQNFGRCTLLIIAHRLNTVIECERILVMDNGTIVEFDHPYNLINDTKSLFSKMVKETGNSMAKNLTMLAEDNYRNHKWLSQIL